MRSVLVGSLTLIAALAVLDPDGIPDLSERGLLTSIPGESFDETVRRWNGNIFWVPASKSNDIVTRFGDEARAVLGPIPDVSCGSPLAKVFPREVDGNIVDLIPNHTKSGYPLEFAHRNSRGDVVRWTETIPKCDKPSLAGTVTYCGLNSRLHRVVRGSVEWLFLCRKSNSSQEVASNPYWQRSDPRFALLGIIGFNSQSGEIVFFDGRKDRAEFDWSTPLLPPGGRSYVDEAGRAAAAALYDPTFEIQCHTCHDNKSPYVIDPHAAQSRVGYLRGDRNEQRAKFSLGSYLPERPRLENMPFRVIGSEYTKAHRDDIADARTVRDPAGNCTSCHTLTTQVTGKRFAADAVAREPFVANPEWRQTLALVDETRTLKRIDKHRTDWARRGGEGKIHPWMIPGAGNVLDEQSLQITAADWQRLSNCLWGNGGSECGYQPVFTPCLPPESGAEGSSVSEAAINILQLRGESRRWGPVLKVHWKYLNDYGGVPERDDVRFDVAILEQTLSRSFGPPDVSDYPSLDETREAVSPHMDLTASVRVVQSVSYMGHTRWTEPTPATSPRAFELYIPAECGKRYLLRVAPKRFCFDESKVVYGSRDHLLTADVSCG